MIDDFRHKGLRTRLISELRSKGIKNERLLEAMNKVPRHVFFESGFLNYAYQDKAFPIGDGQTISQPYTVAFQTELLEIKKGDKVLEVGTGSGYQAAVLIEMGANLFTVERYYSLYKKSRQKLLSLHYNFTSVHGDGFKGLENFAPFDKIIVTAGTAEIPAALLAQLKTGGLMVVPVGGSDFQQMTRIKRLGDKDYEKQTFGSFAFVPLLPGTK